MALFANDCLLSDDPALVDVAEVVAGLRGRDPLLLPVEVGLLVAEHRAPGQCAAPPGGNQPTSAHP